MGLLRAATQSTAGSDARSPRAPLRAIFAVTIGLLGGSGCADAPTTAPATFGSPRAIPFSSSLSKSSPIAGATSAPVPTLDERSESHPARTTSLADPQAAASSAAAAPAVRMLWQNTTTGDRSIWLMNGTSWDGSYAALPHVPAPWRIAGSGDFNADGHADIVWQNRTTAPDPLGAGEAPNSTTGDIAAMSSGPVVAYVAGGVLKVKQLRR